MTPYGPNRLSLKNLELRHWETEMLKESLCSTGLEQHCTNSKPFGAVNLRKQIKQGSQSASRGKRTAEPQREKQKLPTTWVSEKCETGIPF